MASVAANVFQVGFLFSTKPITPDINRIIPRFGRFFQRAFLSAEAFFNLAKNLLKIAVIVVIVWLNVRPAVPRIAGMATLPFMVGFGFFASMTFRILVEVAIVLLVLSLPDYLFQRWQHLRVAEDVAPGDQGRAQAVRGRPSHPQPPAGTDAGDHEPQHAPGGAAGRRGDHEPDALRRGPRLGAREHGRADGRGQGRGRDGARIREVAAEAGVPLVENRPLARALFAEVEIGDAIPEKYYEVMARILADVYRLGQKAVNLRRVNRGRAGRARVVTGRAVTGGEGIPGPWRLQLSDAQSVTTKHVQAVRTCSSGWAAWVQVQPSMMIIPLPAVLLDALIARSTSSWRCFVDPDRSVLQNALEFTVFPALLLISLSSASRSTCPRRA